ncbi:MAG: DNA-3-methyladenine glycosylase 2 family protein [Myxococcaceae bacterium]
MTDPNFEKTLRRAERALAKADPVLGKVIARVGRCEIAPSPDFDPFHALVRSICHQQLHGKAAETILGRVVTKFGDGERPDVKKLHRARVPSMRTCGLSESKSLAIKDLAAKCLDGTVPTARELHAMENDAIVERVTQVRGIGRWTVEMMLMFRMGRLDVWPVDDFGIRKGFTMLRKLKEPITAKALLPLGDPWRPWRTVASWYMWRVADGR